MSRPTLRLARPPAQQPVEVTRLQGESDSYYTARCAAIAAMGESWWQHPQYQHPPRHSTNPEIWKPAREPFLADIRRRAAVDRLANPLAKIQQDVRDALKGMP
jgi:hypothetical protein